MYRCKKCRRLVATESNTIPVPERIHQQIDPWRQPRRAPKGADCNSCQRMYIPVTPHLAIWLDETLQSLVLTVSSGAEHLQSASLCACRHAKLKQGTTAFSWLSQH